MSEISQILCAKALKAVPPPPPAIPPATKVPFATKAPKAADLDEGSIFLV
jgi:hypothetical protein